MTGRWYAYAGVTTGLGVSVWANMTHAATGQGGPDRGALFLAGFWPVILFLALEVLTRATWTAGWGVVIARAGVTIVAVVAAVVSYLHLHALLLHYGESRVPALAGPLAIDGLMAVSAAALMTRQRRETTPALVADLPQQTPEPVAPQPEPVTPATAPDPEPAPVPLQVAAARVERPGSVTVRAPAAGDPPAVADGRRSLTDLRAQLGAAIAAGDLPACPSAEQIREHLRVGAARARALKAELRAHEPA